MTPTAEERVTVMNDILSSVGVLRRCTWGASPPAKPLAPDWDYEAIVMHNTGHGHIDTMKKIQAFDFADRGWEDISYHYGIAANGTIMEGRQIIYKGADVKNQNTGKIGVVCIGDYDGGLKSWVGGHGVSGDPITTPMLLAMKRLTIRLRLAFPTIKYFGGHIEYGDTADCPGSKMLPVVAAMRQELGLITPIKKPGL